MYIKLSAPINVQWEITTNCNHSCFYCYNGCKIQKEINNSVKSAAEDMAQRVVDEVVNNKVFHITLTGGEPLLVLNKYYDVLLSAKKAGVTMSLNSNLALLNRELIDILKDLEIKSILSSLSSSNPSISDEHVRVEGSFQRIVNGIKLAVKNGFRVAINMVVTKNNIHTIKDTGRLAKDLGAIAFCATKVATPITSEFNHFSYCLDSDLLNQMFFDLLWVEERCGIKTDSLEHYPACSFSSSLMRRKYGKRSCTAGKTSCTIGVNGEIRPCSHAHLSYGNCESGLFAAWNYLEDWRTGVLIPASCKKSCKEFPFRCGGGCRLEAFKAKGDLKSKDPYCQQDVPMARRNRYSKKYLKENVFKLVEQVKFRREKFGYISYISPSKWLAIDCKLYDLLTANQNGHFSKKEMMKLFRAKESDVELTLRKLIEKGLIRVVENPKKERR